METDEQLLNPNIWRTKTFKKHCKSTRLMVLFTNTLCSKDTKYLKVTLNFGHFSARSSTILIACWLSIFVSTVCIQIVSWIDISAQKFKRPAGVFQRKTENINVYTFWSSLQIFGSDLKLTR